MPVTDQKVREIRREFRPIRDATDKLQEMKSKEGDEEYKVVGDGARQQRQIQKALIEIMHKANDLLAETDSVQLDEAGTFKLPGEAVKPADKSALPERIDE